MNAEAKALEPVEAVATSLIQVIERAARDPAFDIDKMERLLQMQERIVAKGAETAFNAAMTAAQAEMSPISADATNPQTHSKYASYAKLDKVLRPIYVKHGFALSFDEADSPKPEYVRVLCHVSHIAGHTRTYTKELPADGKGPKGSDVMTKTHAAGAAMAYAMRYLVKGIFNVAVGEDDKDGNESLPLINEKQVADLKAMLEELGPRAYANFLKAGKINTLAEVPAKNYDACVKLIEDKKRAKA
jgi:ERF superfamily